MKVSRYPDTKFANFGVRNGELYAGDVTESGRRIKLPTSFLQTVANYTQDGGRFNMLRNTFGTTGDRKMDAGVDVEGSNILFTTFGTPANLTFYVDALRCIRSPAFRSTRGVTAGKTLRPFFGGLILDENDDPLYSIRYETQCAARWPSPIIAQYGGGSSRILCENDNSLLIQSKPYTGSSVLAIVPKVIDAANGGADGAYQSIGQTEFEYVGVDTDGRNILICWCDGYQSWSASGADGSNLSSRIYVLRETATKNFSFVVEAKHTMGYSGSTNGAHGFAVSAPMNVSRQLDANGAVTSFNILTVDDQRATQNVAPANLQLQWATFTIGTSTITKALQPIAVPGLWATGRIGKTSQTGPGTCVNIYPMIHDNKVRALITLGTFLRSNNIREVDFPITIFEQAIVNGQLSGTPTFTDLPDSSSPGKNFFLTLPDYTAGYLWQIEDAWGLSGAVQIRCIDLANKSVEYTTLNGEIISAGVHRGRLLVMMSQQGGNKMHKFILEPDEIQRRIVLSFDQSVYQQGAAGVLTVTSNANIDVVVELDGCQLANGSDSVPVALVANTPYTLNVTVTGSPSASISEISEVV